jgi:hypothetical protein
MNLAPLFQALSQTGGQYADARLQAPLYRLKLLMDKLKAEEEPINLEDMKERLRRLKLQPATEQEALQEKLSAIRQASQDLGITLGPGDLRAAIGLPQERAAQTRAEVEKQLGRPMTDEEAQRFFGIAPKEITPKEVKIKTVPGTDEPYQITDTQGKTWDVNDPQLPDPLKKELGTYKEAQSKGEEKKALIEARKNAEAINRAMLIMDKRELMKARDEVRKVAHRGISGHSFLKTVAQEVATAELTGGKGTTSGDMLIVEGFMQLMFGVDPKALRGSPKMMEVLLKQGGWDDRAIAQFNSAYSGGKLSQDVRNQILEAATRQVTSWDQAVSQTALFADDPVTKSMAAKYAEEVAKGNDLSDLGGKKQ